MIVVDVELVVRNNSSRSPGCTDCGIVTEWLGRFPAVVAEPTYVIAPGETASCGLMLRVVWSVDWPSLTVSVTVRGPLAAYGVLSGLAGTGRSVAEVPGVGEIGSLGVRRIAGVEVTDELVAGRGERRHRGVG